jgi:hypothetical protein
MVGRVDEGHGAARRWQVAAADRMPTRLAFGGALLAVVAVALLAGFLVLHDTPRGLVNFAPLPRWARPFTQDDGLNYRIHVGLGTVFETVGAPPSATASEWFKGAYHARTPAQMARTANGLVAVRQRTSPEQVEATLCPALLAERSDGLPARAERQVEVLAMAGLSCELSVAASSA